MQTQHGGPGLANRGVLRNDNGLDASTNKPARTRGWTVTPGAVIIQQEASNDAFFVSRRPHDQFLGSPSMSTEKHVNREAKQQRS